ncbi:MAG: hypothetical protein ACRCZI_13775 [Cetobacterium sp.]
MDIIAGIYKKYKHGTYLRASGTKMCAVKLNGDVAMERNLRLTSIKKTPLETGNVVISQEHYNELMQDMKALTDALALLELKARRYARKEG